MIIYRHTDCVWSAVQFDSGLQETFCNAALQQIYLYITFIYIYFHGIFNGKTFILCYLQRTKSHLNGFISGQFHFNGILIVIIHRLFHGQEFHFVDTFMEDSF